MAPAQGSKKGRTSSDGAVAGAVKAETKKAAATSAGAADEKVKLKKKNKLIRPRGKRGGIKKKHVKDELTGRWSRTNIPATPRKADQTKKGGKQKKPDGPHAEGEEEAEEEGSTAHASHISRFHALTKRLASASTPPAERAQIEAELNELGGLEAYQDASLTGACAGGESGRWVGSALLKATAAAPSSATRRRLRLLDVGAIRGTAFEAFKERVEAVSIDLNPRSGKVYQADFLQCAVPKPRVDEEALSASAAEENASSSKDGEEKDAEGEDTSAAAFTPTPLPQEQVTPGFDVVNLSLVLNFIGDLAQRGEMLLRPHAFLRASLPSSAEGKEGDGVQGGFLSLILPLPCLTRSRYCTDTHLLALLSATGWDLVERADSKRLARWLLREKRGVRQAGEVGCADVWETWWDGTEFGRKELRVGVRFNNFCVKLVRDGAGGSGDAGAATAGTSSGSGASAGAKRKKMAPDADAGAHEEGVEQQGKAKKQQQQQQQQQQRQQQKARPKPKR
ncbi:25S rRNA (adenine2142-N1)-methyltransferase [Tilletia horrida]|nr:25S rRNA (adenine2142-N1)-methyltransferase [Tilletia horrida]